MAFLLIIKLLEWRSLWWLHNTWKSMHGYAQFTANHFNCSMQLFSKLFITQLTKICIWISSVVLRIIHYDDVIMGAIASLITNLTIVYSTVYSDAEQRKHQSSAPLAFVWGIHRGPVKSPHKWPVTRKMFRFDDVIMSPKFSKPDIKDITCHTWILIGILNQGDAYTSGHT